LLQYLSNHMNISMAIEPANHMTTPLLYPCPLDFTSHLPVA